MARKGFPVLAVIVLVFSLVWLLNELEVISFTLPWFPVILIIISVGMIVNRFMK